MIAAATRASAVLPWEQALADLERSRVRFVPLRARADEVDVLISASERCAFDAALERAGFHQGPRLAASGTSADRDRRFHYVYVDDRPFVVESFTVWAFDPAGGHRHRWTVPGLSEEILGETDSGRERSKAAQALGRVLHEVINRGGQRPDRLRSALLQWIATDRDRATARRFIGSAAVGALDEAASCAAADRDLPEEDALREVLVRSVRRASWTVPMDHARRSLQSLVDRALYRRLRRRQVAISVLGPDGVGKSTAVSHIEAFEPPPRTQWTVRYNGRPRSGFWGRWLRRVAKTAATGLEGAVLIGRRVSVHDLARLGEIRLKRWEGRLSSALLRIRGSHLLDVVLLDRGLADEVQFLTSAVARERARRLLAAPVPGTEFRALLLSDDPASIHRRKQELTEHEIAEYLDRIREAGRIAPPPGGFAEVSLSGLTPIDTARRVRADLVECLDRYVAGTPVTPALEAVHFVVLDFPGPGAPLWNGVHKAVAGLAGALGAHGVRASVLNIVRPALAHPDYRRDTYDVTCAPRDHLSWLSATLRSWAQNLPAGHLVVLNGIFSPVMVALARALARAGRPYVFVPHQPYNEEVFRQARWRKLPWWLLFERPMLRRAAAIQLLDPRHARMLRERGVCTPTVVLPNGYGPSASDPGWTPLSRHDGAARLFYFGRIETHYKGLDLLLKAAAAHPDVDLTIQGPDWGDLAQLRRHAASLGVGDRVHFVEADRETPPTDIMAAYDVVCLPSRCEGFGLAALEGMLSGRPLLLSDVGGLAETVRGSRCGEVVEATEEGVIRGLGRLLDQRDNWPEMGRAGREAALRGFAWSEIARRGRSLYDLVYKASERAGRGR